MTAHGERGITLVEILVGLVLFGVIAGGATETLLTAHRARVTSARWMRATALAEERLEALRAGDRSGDDGPIGAFTRTWRAAAEARAPALERVDIEVSWEDRGPQRFVLSAFLRTLR